jgi:NADH:ubiquinone oxidoreductase subunit 3 (subunit A)
MPALVLSLLVFLAVGTIFLFIHLLMGSVIRPNRPEPEKLTVYECGEPTVGSAWIQFDLRYYVVALLFVVFDVEVAFFFPWAVVFGTTNTVRNTLAGSDAVIKAKVEEYVNTQADAELVKLQRDLTAKESEIESKRAQLQQNFRGVPMPAELAKGFDAQIDNERARVAKLTTAVEKKRNAELARIAQASPTDLRSDLARTIYQRELKVSLPRLPDQTPERDRITLEAARSWSWIAFLSILLFFSVLMVGFAYLWRRGDIDWVRAITPSAVVQPSTAAMAASPHERELAEVHSKA